MTPKSIIKPVVLTTVELGTTFAVGLMLNKAITTVLPDLGSWNEEWTRKEKAIKITKLLGISVGIGLLASVAATAARTATERIIWNDTEDIDPEN
jgi:uncharacterized membrane protein